MTAVHVLWSFFNPTTAVTLVIGLIVYNFFLFYNRVQRLQNWRQQGIKGPNPWLLYIRVLEFIIKPNAHLLEVKAIEKYGKVYGSTDIDNNFLVIADASLLKDVLVKNFHHFMGKNPISNAKYISKFLVLQSGSEWKHTRSIMSPTFTSGKMKAMLPLMKDCMKSMIDSIRRTEGKDIDAKTLFGGFTMDVIARCAFAVETNAHENPKHPFVVNATKFLAFPLLKLLLIFVTPEFIRNRLHMTFMDSSATDYLVKLGHHMIEERRRIGIKSEKRSYNDFLQLMLEAGRDTTETDDTEEHKVDIHNEQKTLTDEEIIGNIILILMAGFETTSSLLTFVSYVLAVHPEVQEKLRQEIQEAKDNNEGVLEYDTLMSLPYLEAVINETLRMYSPLIKVDRQCGEDITLDYNGKQILMRKGDAFVVPIYAIHHMEEYYPEPEKFKPERFLPENKDQLTPYTFLAFVAGPRNCIGLRFALLEAKLALSHLLLEFDFVPSPRTSIPLDFSGAKILLNAKEIVVSIRSRQ